MTIMTITKLTSAYLAFACVNDLDCELLGKCDVSSGACACSPGFTGPSCGQLDLLPVPAATLGLVWPPHRAPFVVPNRTADPHATSIGWSFAPVYDPATKRYVAAIESVCDKWGGDVWLAAVSSAEPNKGWRFERRLGPAGTNCPHMKRLKNGTFALVLNAMRSGMYPANETKDPMAPICVGDALPASANASELMSPTLRPCGANEAPTLGDNCLCSRVSSKCARSSTNVYMATTETFPNGPWRIAKVNISGPGWRPFNATLSSIGTSNPTFVPLLDGRTLLSFRSHAGYWPSIDAQLNTTWGGEHTGFALADADAEGGIAGPFTVSGNLSWEYGNDEDPFVWQQKDGTMHALYHNGRGGWTNHGLHAFSRDGVTWHKPADALLPRCAAHSGGGGRPANSSLYHNCSALYTNFVALSNGSATMLEGRERPALLFDSETGAPTWLFNGAIAGNGSRNWYAMAQGIMNTNSSAAARITALDGSTCINSEDCSLNGNCTNGACVCRTPWQGVDCAQLQILPSSTSSGGAIYGVSPRTGSWGGNIVQWADGKFHLFVAEFAGNDCGMVSWKTNSMITHAISETGIDGTYARSDTALDAWAHNPEVVVYKNELFLFHIGPGDGSSVKVNCSHSSQAFAAPGNYQTSPVGNAQTTFIHAAPGPHGPWMAAGSVECDNPAPLVLRNGTVLLMCSRSPTTSKHSGTPPHWRLHRADSPRGPWTTVAEVYPTSNRTGPQTEDPFIWEDVDGNLHAIGHTFPPGGPSATGPSHVVSMHGYSRDGVAWKWSKGQPYDATVQFPNGTNVLHATAERPKLFIDSHGVPTHLVNGMQSALWPCDGCIGCKKDSGHPVPGCKGETHHVCNKCKMLSTMDYTYTIIRNLQT